MKKEPTKITIVGNESLVKLLRSDLYGNSGTVISFIKPIYEALCDNRKIIEDSDILILDSIPEIYSPSYFYIDGMNNIGDEYKKSFSPMISFVDFEVGKLSYNEIVIVKKNGIFNFFHNLKSGKPKKIIVFSPTASDYDYPSNDKEFTILRKIISAPFAKMLILTDEQRKFIGKHIYWDVFSFIFRKARDCKVNINSHFLSRKRSPIESCRAIDFALSPLSDDSFCENIRNWKFMIHNDFSFRHKYKNENIALNEKYPSLFVHTYPYSNDVIEKRNIALTHVLSNYCAKNGFKLLEDNFKELLNKYNAKQKFPVEINSSVMLPWEKEIIASSQIKQNHVLIHGESGTGKEMTAELINLKTFGKEGKKLTKVNCALIDTNLATSLLFGHEKGSFTGANKSTHGLIYNARNGALFLDEIHYLPADTLGKLLRFMEDGIIAKLGAQNEIHCDVKIIAATNSNEFMENKKLHDLGLIHRFNFSVYIPPVRVRLSEGFDKLFEAMWRKAISYYEKNQKVEIINDPIHEIENLINFDLNEVSKSHHSNIEESLKKYLAENKSNLTQREISSLHVNYCYNRCFDECYTQDWENSNLRGIYNHILNSITSYIILHPDFIYKRNVENVSHSSNTCASAINSPGRKSAVEFDELYELMMNFKKQNKNGIELQKEISTKYGALEKKNSLNNYLQRHKTKYKSNMSVLEKIEELRNTLRTDGCFANYPA